MKVLMQPHVYHFRNEESGIRRVVEAYFKHLPKFGVELVLPDTKDYDLKAVHAGMTERDCDICHCHGLYWSADYQASLWEWNINGKVIAAVRYAKEVTVPSAWVAEAFQRDMRFTPHIIPHGIDWDDWQHSRPIGDYVLWNKNRASDACDPTAVIKLAERFPGGRFVTTFLPPNAPSFQNVKIIGSIPHSEMKKLVQSANVYLSTVKETFGIGALEAMASGVPVLGWRNGGNIDIVQHGVCGYLAEPGDTDDLAEGLLYCIQNRATLGANGRELAREWTWERACEMVADVYRKALEPDPPTVGVVIPVFNKSVGEVGRALESAVRQTYKGVAAIVIVDDGSADPKVAQEAVARFADTDGRIQLVRQDNRGVAVARNRGIDAAGNVKYVCCLDADDAIEPEFIERCVSELEMDPGLGIAYTGLRWVKPDGSTGISEWPPDFDYDKQLQRKNQIPTCCVFRKVAWERLGGYRQRYAPGGCGAEDAEFWLRMGAYGWNAKKITPKPLFIYSWQSGLVSGDSEYREVDWTSWHPWAGKDGDGKHPFASRAKPKYGGSHPVRQYDEPLVSVVIPVGPGHEAKVVDALDSLEAQTLRKWEAVMVWDNVANYQDLMTAYPYVKLVETGGVGAGCARNRGVEAARAPFIVFLDADDALRPEALDKMVRVWHEHKAIVYTDYVGIAHVDDINGLAPDLRGRVYEYDEKNKRAVIGYRASDYDCHRAQRQPEGERPWIWCNVTALIPKTWHDEIGGFDESMPSWEDVDYHYRMARTDHCYVRLPEELLVYQFGTGGRRERGVQSNVELVHYMRQKYQGVEVAGCRGCGSKKVSATASARSVIERAPTVQAVAAVSDSDFVMISYQHPNRGTHRVIGERLFPERVSQMPMVKVRDGWRFDYGYRAGEGVDQFLVHKDETKLKPNWYVPLADTARTMAPKQEKAPLPPPEPITEEAPELLEGMTGGLEDIADLIEIIQPFDLQTLPGVGPKLAEQMQAGGINTKEKVLALGKEGLAKFPGINEIKASMILAAIQAMDQKEEADSGYAVGVDAGGMAAGVAASD